MAGVIFYPAPGPRPFINAPIPFYPRLENANRITQVAVVALLTIAAIWAKMLYMVPLIVGGFCVFLYKDLVRINQINERMDQRNIELEGVLREFLVQNASIIAGLDRAEDIRYDPTPLTPPQYICPIRMQIIRQPVMIIEGNREIAYERSAIEGWYNAGNRTTPLTRSPLPNPANIETNLAFRIEIVRHIKAL